MEKRWIIKKVERHSSKLIGYLTIKRKRWVTKERNISLAKFTEQEAKEYLQRMFLVHGENEYYFFKELL